MNLAALYGALSLDLPLDMSDQQQGQRNKARFPSLPNGVGNPPPSPLFPLDRLLQELLQQEEVLWRRNEMHLQSLRAGRELMHPSLLTFR